MTQAEENLRKVSSALIDRAVPVVEADVYALTLTFLFSPQGNGWLCCHR